ncbi:MAG: hypothetical protein EXR27_03685 [Betaproteobacteria bacterium]|nr:hypothetical protein [Betaproteobacteria bacterium]
MAVIEILDVAGAVVWTSPEGDELLYETVDNTVKVIEMNTGQVIAAYHLKPGERVAKEGAAGRGARGT